MRGISLVIKDFSKSIDNQRVVFVTTRETSYIRNAQEIRLLKKGANSVTVVASENKKYLFRILEVYKKLLQLKNSSYDAVMLGFSPQLVLPVFAWKFRKKKVMIDFFISIYDTFVLDRKKFSKKSIIAKIMRYIDVWTLRHASEIIVDTKADMAFFAREFRCDESKFSVLYLEADDTIYYPREQRKPEHLKDKFVVLYFGSILPLQGVKVILEAIRTFKDDNRFHFQMIGPIDEKFDKPIQENVEYIEWLSQEELADYIANADLCLAGHFHGEIDKARRTIPGKAYIYEMMGKRMVLGDNEANRELYHEGDSNIKFVEMGNVTKLAESIKGYIN